MSEASRLAGAAGSKDPAIGLRAVAALRKLLDRLEELQVANARDQGWSWQEIAGALGVSRQAVHKKHADRMEELRTSTERIRAALADAIRGGRIRIQVFGAGEKTRKED